MSNSKGFAVIFQGVDKNSLKPILTNTEVDIPTQDDLLMGEVLVKLETSSICNSDVHTLQGRRKEPTPSILGHEGCGIIQLSKKDGFIAGTRVTFSIMDSCANCRNCFAGLEQKCDHLFKYGHSEFDGKSLSGCYSTHIILKPGTLIVPLPDNLSFELAAPLNCALATMVAARRIAVKALGSRLRNSNCVIFGAGMLGIFGAVLMKEEGMNVFISDVSQERLKVAKEFGCETLSLGELSNHAYDVVLEACGVGKVVEAALPCLNVGGIIILVGSVTPNTEFTITAESLVRKCATISGLHNYSKKDLEEAVKFLSLHQDKYKFSSVMSKPVPLTEFYSALSTALEQTYLRVIIDNTK